MKATFELLSTKDKNNFLTFHEDNFFMNKEGVLKIKYYNALKSLQKENVIKLTANFDVKNDKWNYNWKVII